MEISSKNIVICADGTGNSYFGARTNVLQLFEMALMLDVPAVVAEMRQAFPRRMREAGDRAQYAEAASYRPQGIDDYGRIETEILAPMEEAYEFIREIGTGISHHFGAFG